MGFKVVGGVEAGVIIYYLANLMESLFDEIRVIEI